MSGDINIDYADVFACKPAPTWIRTYFLWCNGSSDSPLLTIRPLLLHLHRRLGAISIVFSLVIRVIEAALQRKQAATKVKRAGEVHAVLQFQGLEVVTHVGGNGCDFFGAER
ncbi:hypothetical protein AB7M29_001925 [Pseudomonas sp. F-14 TE3623]